MDVGAVAMLDTDSGLDAGWHAKGAFMEINVRAYHDSDGDGVGDLNGVTQKLDYLRDLGIAGIWLMPIHKTDNHDSGYIVTDHRAIEVEYGTLDDLKRLITEAHRRGIGVIMDYVPNHAASTNPLFENAVSSRGAAYRDWFIIAPTKPQGWTTWNGKNPWYASGPSFYYAAFNQDMPDFNWRNPEVVEYHKDNLRYWLNQGVDGFRFDAIQHLVENGPDGMAAQPESHAIMRELKEVVHSYSKRYVVCEDPNQPDLAAADSVCGSAFAFGLNERLRRVAHGDTSGLGGLITAFDLLPLERMGTLLANHDRFAGLRLMDEFAGDETSYRLAAASLLTLPGIPFVYYGEEIGMRSMPLADFDSTSDWPLRGPMSWASQPSVTDNTRLGPFADLHYFRPAPNIATHNVSLASSDPNSLWSFYKQLLTLRRNTTAVHNGSFRIVATTSSSLVYERGSATESVLVVINYGPSAEALNLTALTPGLRYESVVTHGASATTLDVPASGSATLDAPARSVRVLLAHQPSAM